MTQLEYYEKYHEITQSLIGLMRLYSTPEQREKVKVWDEKLDDLHIRHCLSADMDEAQVPMLAEIMNWDYDKALKIYKEIHG